MTTMTEVKRPFRKRPRPAEAAPAGGQIRVRSLCPGVHTLEDVPPERISDLIGSPGVLLWVDVRDPGPAEIDLLREEFGFEQLSLADAAKQRLRPKVDEYPNYYLIVMYAPLPMRPRLPVETTEVDIFVGQNYIVSLHPGHVPALADAMRRWESTTAVARDRVGFLAHIVVDAIVDAYFPVTDNIDERLDRLESYIFRGGSSGNPEELLSLKRSVFALRKAIYPLRDAFHTFPRREHALFDLETHPYFQDVYDHILRLLDIVDIQRDMITDAMDAHLAFVSNSLNETMKTLTVLGICVAIAGAVFGAWGMNVRGVPFAFTTVHGVYVGFWLICLMTVGLMALGLLWAKRRGAL